MHVHVHFVIGQWVKGIKCGQVVLAVFQRSQLCILAIHKSAELSSLSLRSIRIVRVCS